MGMPRRILNISDSSAGPLRAWAAQPNPLPQILILRQEHDATLFECCLHRADGAHSAIYFAGFQPRDGVERNDGVVCELLLRPTE